MQSANPTELHTFAFFQMKARTLSGYRCLTSSRFVVHNPRGLILHGSRRYDSPPERRPSSTGRGCTCNTISTKKQRQRNVSVENKGLFIPAKVMFSHLYVILFTREGLGSLSRGLCLGGSLSGGLCAGGIFVRETPRTVMRGQYTSYWNAFPSVHAIAKNGYITHYWTFQSRHNLTK